MNKYIVELVGTFFFVFTIGMTVLTPGIGAFAPLAIGTALAVMVYAGGHVSGGHYNPAVTLAVWIRGKCRAVDVPAYWVAQLAGAGLAAYAALYLKGFPTVEAGTPDVLPSLLAEFLFTFALVWVVLNTATAPANAGNSHYGLAIGATVMVGAYAVGGISGGAFNPAVAVGITVMGLSSVANLWIFLVANFAAGLVAAILYKAVVKDVAPA
jgi:aquaporin Z